MPVCRPRHHLYVSLVTALVVASLGTLTGCSLPPAISKAELDATRLPEKHPNVPAKKQEAGCRGCHREQAKVK